MEGMDSQAILSVGTRARVTGGVSAGLYGVIRYYDDARGEYVVDVKGEHYDVLPEYVEAVEAPPPPLQQPPAVDERTSPARGKRPAPSQPVTLQDRQRLRGPMGEPLVIDLDVEGFPLSFSERSAGAHGASTCDEDDASDSASSCGSAVASVDGAASARSGDSGAGQEMVRQSMLADRGAQEFMLLPDGKSTVDILESRMTQEAIRQTANLSLERAKKVGELLFSTMQLFERLFKAALHLAEAQSLAAESVDHAGDGLISRFLNKLGLLDRAGLRRTVEDLYAPEHLYLDEVQLHQRLLCVMLPRVEFLFSPVLDLGYNVLVFVEVRVTRLASARHQSKLAADFMVVLEETAGGRAVKGRLEVNPASELDTNLRRPSSSFLKLAHRARHPKGRLVGAFVAETKVGTKKLDQWPQLMTYRQGARQLPALARLPILGLMAINVGAKPLCAEQTTRQCFARKWLRVRPPPIGS